VNPFKEPETLILFVMRPDMAYDAIAPIPRDDIAMDVRYDAD
jgi:hypothetical protein